MAEDCRISTDFPGHYKTINVKRRLGLIGCWHLMCLFLFAANRRWDGDLAGMSDQDIESACGWEGDAGSFVSVLCEAGYLDGEPGHRVIHDWAEHNPYAANRGKRIEKAKKAIAARWESQRNTKGKRKNTRSIPPVYGGNTPATPATPATPLPPKADGADAPAPKKGTRIPEKFCVTAAHREFAHKNNLPNPDNHIDHFCDYWRSIPGAKGLKIDWDATFRNWLRSENSRIGGPNARPTHTPQSTNLSAFDRRTINNLSATQRALQRERERQQEGGDHPRANAAGSRS